MGLGGHRSSRAPDRLPKFHSLPLPCILLTSRVCWCVRVAVHHVPQAMNLFHNEMHIFTAISVPSVGATPCFVLRVLCCSNTCPFASLCVCAYACVCVALRACARAPLTPPPPPPPCEGGRVVFLSPGQPLCGEVNEPDSPRVTSTSSSTLFVATLYRFSPVLGLMFLRGLIHQTTAQ